MSDELTQVFAFPAQILPRASQSNLLDLAKTRAFDPAIFDDHAPYFWPARISTSVLDSWYTRMRPSSLQNYAADAAAGVSFQDSHRTDSLARTLGHSLTGTYAGPQGNGIAHTDADFYTVTGIDDDIDRFVLKMRTGIVRDVSIGFHGGQYICSVCNRDMLDWTSGCWHLSGFYAHPVDKEGNPDRSKEKVLVTADVENAHLAEVSAVFEGATPGAVILKAQRMAEAGKLEPQRAQLIESRYRIHLPGATHVYQGTAAITGNVVTQDELQGAIVRGIYLSKENPMPGSDEERSTPEADPGQRALTILATLRGLFADTTDDGIVTRIQSLQDENARLAPLAAIGETFRTQRITRAITEGKRAYGEQFDEPAKRAVLERLTIEEIDERGDLWEERATLTLQGGRQSRDTDERAAPAVQTTPDAAFAA